MPEKFNLQTPVEFVFPGGKEVAPARLLCVDARAAQPIIALNLQPDGTEHYRLFTQNGDAAWGGGHLRVVESVPAWSDDFMRGFADALLRVTNMPSTLPAGAAGKQLSDHFFRMTVENMK